MKKRSVKFIAIFIFLANSFSGCGNSPSDNPSDSAGQSEKIINGVPADPATSPQIVQVRISTLSNGEVLNELCTGTVISANKILTAAHCFEGGIVQAASIFSPIVGEVAANRVVIHPLRYSNPADPSYKDMAIVTTVTPHGLPAMGITLSHQAAEGDGILIMGYGLDDDQNVGTLRMGSMILASATFDTLLAQYQKPLADTCFGDSGGPAFYTKLHEDGSVESVGMVAITKAGSSDDCSEGEISIFESLQDPVAIAFIQQEAPEAVFY